MDSDAAITALRGHFEEMRRQVLAEPGAADADQATRLLVNRLLHTPSAALRSLGADNERTVKALLCQLFGLAPPGAPDRREPERLDSDHKEDRS